MLWFDTMLVQFWEPSRSKSPWRLCQERLSFIGVPLLGCSRYFLAFTSLNEGTDLVPLSMMFLSTNSSKCSPYAKSANFLWMCRFFFYLFNIFFIYFSLLWSSFFSLLFWTWNSACVLLGSVTSVSMHFEFFFFSPQLYLVCVEGEVGGGVQRQ